MKNLTEYLSEISSEILLKHTNARIALLDRKGGIIETNEVMGKILNAAHGETKLENLLVFSSRQRFRDMLGITFDGRAPIRAVLNFVSEENDLPDSCACLIFPLDEEAMLLYAEPLPPLDKKQAKEYLRLSNDFASANRALQKTRHELTQKKKMLEEALGKIEHLARIDHLTDLPNRRSVMERLKSEISRSRRYKSPLSLFILDIDHFKKVNDTHGHQEGDRVLHRCGEIMNNTHREADFIGRYGGEEFICIMPEIGIENARESAERLRRSIENEPFPLKSGKNIQITISIGVSQFHHEHDHQEALLARADEALYEAKENGRNRVCKENFR